MISETSKIGKRGTVIIPATLRRRFGLEVAEHLRIRGLVMKGTA